MSKRCELPSPPARRIRTLSALIAVLVAATFFAAVPATPAGADDVSDWLSTINGYRSANGLPQLQYDAQLSGLAVQQAQANAGAGRLAHTPNLAAGVSANWSKLGENVGMGLSTPIIWDAFLNSSPHRANLLDPAFTHIGIGVVMSGSTQWVTHRFMAVGAAAPAPPPPPPPQPEPVSVPPPTQPPRIVTPAPTVPPTVAPTIPTTVPVTVPEPEPVVVPAASAPDRAAALLDALYRIEG